MYLWCICAFAVKLSKKTCWCGFNFLTNQSANFKPSTIIIMGIYCRPIFKHILSPWPITLFKWIANINALKSAAVVSFKKTHCHPDLAMTTLRGGAVWSGRQAFCRARRVQARRAVESTVDRLRLQTVRLIVLRRFSATVSRSYKIFLGKG